MLMLTKR